MHLEIPEPCHENWNAMTPQEKGSFCDKCCKVVIDFTNMATDKVIEFISERKNEKVCGRFRPDQIVVPVSQKNNLFTHRAKLFLAALVFVFGGMLFTGCKTHTPEKMGKVQAANFSQNNFGLDSPAIKKHTPKDTASSQQDGNHIKGKVKCDVRDTTKNIHQQVPMGGPMLIEDEVKHPLMGKPTLNPKDTLK